MGVGGGSSIESGGVTGYAHIFQGCEETMGDDADPTNKQTKREGEIDDRDPYRAALERRI